MTEQEARRILAEHRTECPAFVRGRRFYEVRRDGRIDVWSGNSKTERWRFEYTTTADDICLPPDIRRRLAA
jgi:hypothetical protein